MQVVVKAFILLSMLHVALKEWSIVCDLLLSGELAILLRKGGIREPGGAGRFELEHSQFALFPSWAHQQPERIKRPHRQRVQVFAGEPKEIIFYGYAQVNHIWPVPSREAFDALEDLHCWTPPQVDMRFDYKPDRPLYLMILRAFRLAKPKTVVNSPEYAGCRSWIALSASDGVDEANAAPAIGDQAFEQIIFRCDQAMRSFC